MPNFDLEDHLPFRIAAAANLLAFDRDPDLMAIADLRLREIRALVDIGSLGPIKAADISFKSRVDHFTISRAVKDLSKLKLIHSEVDPLDRRSSFLTLSNKGILVYNKLIKVISSRTKILEEAFSADEIDSLRNLLKRLEAAAENMLSEKARATLVKNGEVSQDQKDLIKWNNKSNRQ
jgi:DNA-binding MarR family transcriptional regulator